MFNNLRELIVSMPTEQACREYVALQRWNGKPVCPHCGHDAVYVIEGGLKYKCASKACHKKFSVTVGTFMHASNIKLTQWLMAIYVVTAHKKGISSYQLAKDIGTSQKTAWFMIHRIREMMRSKLSRPMENIVEADETYVGGSIANKHISVRKKYKDEGNQWQKNKSAVLGIIERNGEALAIVVEGDTGTKILNTIHDNVAPATHMVTDTHAYYATLQNSFSHATVNHSANEFIKGNDYTNTVEGMFSHFKRMIYGIYHQVSKKHTQRYLDEFIMRWNNRKMKDADRFTLAFNDNMNRPMPWKVLTAVKEEDKSTKRPYEASAKFDYLRKKILQVQGDEVVAEYTSIKEAGVSMKINPNNIGAALKGRRPTAGGYKWIYA